MTTYDIMRHCSLLNVDKVTNVDMTWMNDQNAQSVVNAPPDIVCGFF